MLARAVDALEWFLMQEHSEVVACGNLAHDGHQELVVVVGEVCLLVYRSQLKLVGSDLIVACFERYAEFQTLILQIAHKGEYSLRNGSEVVVIELLILCRLVSHKGTACLHKVGACRPEGIIDQEVLLLPAEEDLHSLDAAVEVATHLRSGIRHGSDGAKQWGFVVESLARI